jgi:hypothetical protein
MMKLNESVLEIEIKSPSELIKRLESFLERTKEVRRLDELPDESKTFVGDFKLSEGLRLHIWWKPISDGKKIINY